MVEILVETSNVSERLIFGEKEGGEIVEMIEGKVSFVRCTIFLRCVCAFYEIFYKYCLISLFLQLDIFFIGSLGAFKTGESV